METKQLFYLFQWFWTHCALVSPSIMLSAIFGLDLHLRIYFLGCHTCRCVRSFRASFFATQLIIRTSLYLASRSTTSTIVVYPSAMISPCSGDSRRPGLITRETMTVGAEHSNKHTRRASVAWRLARLSNLRLDSHYCHPATTRHGGQRQGRPREQTRL